VVAVGVRCYALAADCNGDLPREKQRKIGLTPESFLTGWRNDFSGPCKVDQFPANEFGLFGMSGNVSEWVIGDRHAVPNKHTVAGCYWLYGDPKTHATIPLEPDSRGVRAGFRVVLTNRQAGD
jgi:hypothetical protein